jgi:photosystem I subunit 2
MLISNWRKYWDDGYKLPKRKKYVMTWTNKTAVEENIFEMPTGGAAIMKQGPNLVYFAKEQCLALGSQLRSLKLMITVF